MTLWLENMPDIQTLQASTGSSKGWLEKTLSTKLAKGTTKWVQADGTDVSAWGFSDPPPGQITHSLEGEWYNHQSCSSWSPRGKRQRANYWAEQLKESLRDAAWCCGCHRQCQYFSRERKPELQPDMVSHQISRECTEWLTGIKNFARKLPVL